MSSASATSLEDNAEVLVDVALVVLVALDDEVVELADDASSAVRSVVIAFSRASADAVSLELLVVSVDEVDVVDDVLSDDRSVRALDELDDEVEELGGGPPGGGPGGGAPIPEPDDESLLELDDDVLESPLDI